jgi:hypothetical protein
MPRDDRDDDLDISIGRQEGREPEIPSYLTQAILVTLCCCQLFGIVAIVFAAQVSSHVARGDYQAARKASDQARLWCTIGFVGGLIANLLIGLFVILSEMQPGRF